MRSSRSRIYIWLALLTVIVGVVTNVATSQIPAWLQPYLWLSWPILAVFAFVFVLLSVREALGRDYEIPATDQSIAEDASPQHLVEQDWCEACAIEQQVHFCTTLDGVRLAYATIGEGPVLVKVANWLTHLDLDWRIPAMHTWLEELSRNYLLVRYDERGCGLSDWDIDDFSFDAWVRDLETVVDTLGLDRFSLLGMSQGGPVAIAYTVRHCDKVKQLILYGSFARGVYKHELTQSQIEQQEALHTFVQRWWGRDNPAFRQFYTSLFMPEATDEQMRPFNELQRMSTSPENAMRFLIEFGKIDVRDLAPKVTVPTLILHCRGDMVVPFKEGRELATLIPNARFVPLESKNHILLESEPAWQQFLGEFRRFAGMEGDLV